MRTPVPPPSLDSILRTLREANRELAVLADPTLAKDPDYHPWDWFFRHQPPPGFTCEDRWVAVRLQRLQTARPTPFTLRDGMRLTYNLPDPLLRLIEEVSTRSRGEVALPEQVTNPATRDRYLVSSLTEEAITSSQLEGASTSRVRAKAMLRERRAPRDRSEQMILNNYQAMQRIIDLKDEALTPELVSEIHRRVTAGTLDDPADAGRIQRPGDERVRIYGTDGQDQVLHVPLPAGELPERMQVLCTFANDDGAGSDTYLPPLLRALTIHFMMGHDHYFADGNGRTSRAVFYWSMLHQGFFLTEFLSISRLLRKAPAQYARSFLLTEQDGGDLTYFFLDQARVVVRAINELETYLARKSAQLQESSRALRGTGLNHRQVGVIERFLRDPGASTTVADHEVTYGVVAQTARTDLLTLEQRGYLASEKQGRRVVWYPAADLPARLGT